MHNFTLVNVDTDAISFCKDDQTSFTQEEQESLISEINSLLPELIQFTHDGYFQKIIVIKAKNYIMYDGKKLKIKGSALKKSTSEPAIKEFVKRFIDYLVFDKQDQLLDLYNEYIREVLHIDNIQRWCSRKTISEKVLNGTRANETKVMDAMEDVEFSEGDRVYLFFKPDETLCRMEDFDGTYHVDKYLEKVYKTLLTFKTVCDITKFPNYKLKKNKVLLENL